MEDPCKKCSGCVLYEEMGRGEGVMCLALNHFRTRRLENICPCLNCIVKVVCVKACIERAEFGDGKDGYYEEDKVKTLTEDHHGKLM